MRLLISLLVLLPPSLVAQQIPPVAIDNFTAAVGAPAGPPRSGVDLERATESTASLLRCPVCQGLSINDSPAEMAVNMKRQTRSMLALGYSREQVIEYFEKSYGEYVRLEPKREGLNWVVWLAPLGILLVGAWFAMGALRRTVRGADTGDSHAELVSVPDDLLPWVERVREMAYGRDVMR